MTSTPTDSYQLNVLRNQLQTIIIKFILKAKRSNMHNQITNHHIRYHP